MIFDDVLFKLSPFSFYASTCTCIAGEKSFLQRSTPFSKTSFTLLPSHPEAVHRLSSVDSVVRRFARALPRFCSEEIDFCLETRARIHFSMETFPYLFSWFWNLNVEKCWIIDIFHLFEFKYNEWI